MILIHMATRYVRSGDYLGMRQDIATACWNGQGFRAISRLGATAELARLLVAAGCPDQSWTASGPGKRDFFGPSLHDWAKLAVP